MLYLYRIVRTDQIGYDEYDSHVVLAPTPEQARRVVADSSSEDPTRRAWADEGSAVWLDERRSTVELIGQTLGVLVDCDPQVVLSSFNAG